MTPQTISSKEYIPLHKVRDMLEASGVYEILCLETNRVYIGQSKAIINRAARHFHQLRRGDHSNKALQDDWDRVAKPECFVFKIVQNLDPLDEKLLLKQEQKEIERRRKYGIDLYNDIRIVKVIEEKPVKQKDKKEHKPITSRDYGNKPYERNYSHVISKNMATCTDCGIIGPLNDYLFKSNGEIRCERCHDKHARRLEDWLQKERERISKENGETKRVTSRFRMRWQLSNGSMKDDIIRATARYVSKYGQFPTEAHFNQSAELPDIDDLEVKHHRHVPPGYVDFPQPDKA